MLHISLFSGIGGFDLAADLMGWKNIVSCEINEFGNKHLEYYWPDAYHHRDIHTLTYETIDNELSARFGSGWRNQDIVLSGGFPCQPFSLAGKRKGKNDSRHLWPEMLRVIRETRPTWVLGENVYGIVNWDDGLVFNEIQTDLEAEGYEVFPYILPACAVNAPHRRDRFFLVAYSASNRATPHGNCGTTQGCRRTPLQAQDEGREGTTVFATGLCGIQGDAADTDQHGHAQCGEGGKSQGAWPGDAQVQGGGVQHSEQHKQLFGLPRVDSGGGWDSSEDGNAANTDSNGREQCIGKYEEQPNESRINAQRDPHSGNDDGSSPDTDNTGNPALRSGTDGDGSAQVQEWGQPQPESGRPSDMGDVADSKSLRVNRAQEHEDGVRQGGERRGCDTNDISQIHGENRCSDAADTGGQGLQVDAWGGQSWLPGEDESLTRSAIDRAFAEGEWWTTFPTQSPVCSRNDGLSASLDGITFSKWRSESIKAAGNAVVPVLILQIFRAIEETHEKMGSCHAHPQAKKE